MKRKTTTIILVIIFLMGFSVLLYPVVSSYVNQMDATKATEQYDELMKKMENKKSESILNEANLYNENLTKDNVEYKNQEENKYADILNVDDSGSMGYISIPKIKVKIPIKHGTTDEVLSKYTNCSDITYVVPCFYKTNGNVVEQKLNEIDGVIRIRIIK